MLKRFRRHLSPPMVLSTVAVFVALGGGYAVAFKGSGTLQKAGLDNVGASYTNVRTLNGFPTLQARCNNPNGIQIRFGPNNTGKSVVIDSQEFNTDNNAVDVDQDVMTAGDPASDDFDLPGVGGDAHFQLSKLSPGSKAGVSIDVRGGNAGGLCLSLRVMALNTVE